jgi:hypothetical protein
MNSGGKSRLNDILSRIKEVYPTLLNPELDLINEAVGILGEESFDKRKEKSIEMTELADNINQVLEQLVQGHYSDFNHMIASIHPFSVINI